ncbi:hypothetical protein LWI29_033550 [Acer saccharum]|uniref:Patatin n=1 Tax=Acer saccharum TaxID=4024 RepID=A0AA39TM77_ACESA|nr:hypothetical protein LWI29_033550 [Acer saccharum]
MTSFVGELTGPKYDGKYLRTVINQQLGDVTSKENLTNVLIPAFDIKLLQPVIFSTNDAKENSLKNARIADVCLSTSAAPTFLPAHYFETKDAATGEIRSFDLIDGGVAANNPVNTNGYKPHYQGGVEAEKQSNGQQTNTGAVTRHRWLGEAKKEQKYNAATASEWGLLNWVYDNGKMPLLDVYCDASSDTVDFHVSSLFQCFGTQGNYLRIQEDSLTGDHAASMDISTMENMQKLVEIGTNLLKEPVSRVDLETGRFQKIEGEGTNEEALVEFAKLLSQERKLRSLIN